MAGGGWGGQFGYSMLCQGLGEGCPFCGVDTLEPRLVCYEEQSGCVSFGWGAFLFSGWVLPVVGLEHFVELYGPQVVDQWVGKELLVGGLVVLLEEDDCGGGCGIVLCGCNGPSGCLGGVFVVRSCLVDDGSMCPDGIIGGALAPYLFVIWVIAPVFFQVGGVVEGCGSPFLGDMQECCCFVYGMWWC